MRADVPARKGENVGAGRKTGSPKGMGTGAWGPQGKGDGPVPRGMNWRSCRALIPGGDSKLTAAGLEEKHFFFNFLD